mmetsp:Transcript_136153/g.379543  ORF Transcript_136153/g.379543 Transcript_136153/m.379543 type:complete len:352 (+) Transcript_136153:96-1151(+)
MGLPIVHLLIHRVRRGYPRRGAERWGDPAHELQHVVAPRGPPVRTQLLEGLQPLARGRLRDATWVVSLKVMAHLAAGRVDGELAAADVPRVPGRLLRAREVEHGDVLDEVQAHALFSERHAGVELVVSLHLEVPLRTQVRPGRRWPPGAQAACERILLRSPGRAPRCAKDVQDRRSGTLTASVCGRAQGSCRVHLPDYVLKQLRVWLQQAHSRIDTPPRTGRGTNCEVLVRHFAASRQRRHVPQVGWHQHCRWWPKLQQSLEAAARQEVCIHQEHLSESCEAERAQLGEHAPVPSLGALQQGRVHPQVVDRRMDLATCALQRLEEQRRHIRRRQHEEWVSVARKRNLAGQD